ncbi:MAG: SAM-dependent methyltransferase [Candidatus Methanoplasma sp.]|nr:SAM-dependent methyltransferase [Candidatus Methanoplasma sp.]
MSKEEQYHTVADRGRVKKYGQFFTPDGIVSIMSRWVAGNGGTILDPAVGNGKFLAEVRSIDPTCRPCGYEIDRGILDFFSVDESFDICAEDFLLSDWSNKYDGIVCNPPYNRFQSIDRRKDIYDAFRRMTGVRFSGYTNQYVLFLIKSIYQLKTGGKMAFIVPNEFLNSSYGEEAKSLMIRKGLLRTVINLDWKVFDNALTTACILLLDSSEKNSVKFYNVPDESSLPEPDAENDGEGSVTVGYDVLLNSEKWLPFLKNKPKGNYSNLVPLRTYCGVRRGIATGDNDYFLFNKSKISETGIPQECLTPCICRSSHVSKCCLSQSDFDRIKHEDKDVFILDIKDDRSEEVKSYILHGESCGVNGKYLPAHRRPWYSSEQQRPADIWIASASRGNMKVVRNIAGVSNLTTFHSVYMNKGMERWKNILFCFLLTPTAQEILKENKKELGGGLDKFQPNDLMNACVLDVSLIDRADERLILEIYSKLAAGEQEGALIRDLEAVFLRYLFSDVRPQACETDGSPAAADAAGS